MIIQGTVVCFKILVLRFGCIYIKSVIFASKRSRPDIKDHTCTFVGSGCGLTLKAPPIICS